MRAYGLLPVVAAPSLTSSLVSGAVSAAGSIAQFFSSIFGGHVPYSDFNAQIAPLLQQRARSAGHPAVCYWYGEIIGFTPAGELLRISDKATTTAAFNQAQQTGDHVPWERIVAAYADQHSTRIDLYKSSEADMTGNNAIEAGLDVTIDGPWLLFGSSSGIMGSVFDSISSFTQSIFPSPDTVQPPASFPQSSYIQPVSQPSQAGLLSGSLMPWLLIGGVIAYFAFKGGKK